MKKSYVTFLCAAAIPMIMASCASKPKAEEQSPAPVVEEKVEAAAPVEEEKKEEPVEEAPQNQEDETAKAEAEEKAKAAASEQYKKAIEAKSKIDELGFASYSQADYDGGNESLSNYENLKDSNDAAGTKLLDLANDAYGKFVNVLNKAYKQLAKNARAEAFAEKKNADSVKAGVAAKADYDKAAEEFKAGDTNYAMQNCESAYNHYLVSKKLFAGLFGIVSERRAAAQKAIDEAKAKVEAAQNYAENADHEKPLTDENVEGIEAEDAVLLEADNYEAPEQQEASIPEEIEDFEGDGNIEENPYKAPDTPETPVQTEPVQEKTEDSVQESPAEEPAVEEVKAEAEVEEAPAEESAVVEEPVETTEPAEVTEPVETEQTEQTEQTEPAAEETETTEAKEEVVSEVPVVETVEQEAE